MISSALNGSLSCVEGNKIGGSRVFDHGSQERK